LHRFYTCDWMFDTLRPPRECAKPALPAALPSTSVEETTHV
jgi:hypothetical protein